MPMTKYAPSHAPRVGAAPRKAVGVVCGAQASPIAQFLRDPRVIRLWLFRHRSRAELRALSAGQLEDIGLTRAQADAEAAKPFWKA